MKSTHRALQSINLIRQLINKAIKQVDNKVDNSLAIEATAQHQAEARFIER
jgi:ribosomal protein L31E